jgi:hypothetical protein
MACGRIVIPEHLERSDDLDARGAGRDEDDRVSFMGRGVLGVAEA